MMENLRLQEMIMKIHSSLVIPGNTPSKKSSQVMIPKLRLLLPSERYRKWEKSCLDWFKQVGVEKITEPVRCHFYFYRESRRKFDYVNLIQSVQDLLVKAGIIEDDNADLFIPVVDGYKHDKEHPRCELEFFND